MPRLQTWRGGSISVHSPTPAEVHVCDIVTPLFRIVRFQGHTTRPWTVGEHTILSLLIARHCDPQITVDELLMLLLHDLHEAYVGDICRPIARVLGQQVADIRQRFDDAIYEAFGCDPTQTHNGYYDDLTLAWELANMMWKRTTWAEACESVKVLPPNGVKLPGRHGGIVIHNGDMWMAGLLRALKRRESGWQLWVTTALDELPSLVDSVKSGHAKLRLPRKPSTEPATQG